MTEEVPSSVAAVEEETNSSNKKKKFYVIKRMTRYNQYETISYYDDNGSFKGGACFSDKSKAKEYLQRYQDRLSNHIKEVIGNRGTNSSRHMKYKYRIFEMTDYKELADLKGCFNVD
jgi:hypothetical protein